MDHADVAVQDAILAVAPELDRAELRADARLREDLDLDSMDFLDVVAELAVRSSLEIPERDYARLRTVQDCIDYLTRTPVS